MTLKKKSFAIAILSVSFGFGKAALAVVNKNKTGAPPLQIHTMAHGGKHTYSILQETSAAPFFLEFQEGSKKSRRVALTLAEGMSLRSSATRILWSAKYREPAGLKKCSEYAVLKFETQSAKICLEDKTATAKTFGLLNSLSSLLRR